MSAKKKQYKGRKKRQKSYIEKRVLKEVKRNIKQGLNPIVPGTLDDAVVECGEFLKRVLYYHYILVAIDDFVNAGAITDHMLTYDVRKYSLVIKELSYEFNLIKALEEDIAHLEVLYITDGLKDLSYVILAEFERLEPIYDQFETILDQMAEKLPPALNQSFHTRNQKIDYVIRIIAVSKMSTFILEQPKEEKA